MRCGHLNGSLGSLLACLENMDVIHCGRVKNLIWLMVNTFFKSVFAFDVVGILSGGSNH